jgi:hypothetical protein
MWRDGEPLSTLRWTLWTSQIAAKERLKMRSEKHSSRGCRTLGQLPTRGISRIARLEATRRTKSDDERAEGRTRSPRRSSISLFVRHDERLPMVDNRRPTQQQRKRPYYSLVVVAYCIGANLKYPNTHYASCCRAYADNSSRHAR